MNRPIRHQRANTGDMSAATAADTVRSRRSRRGAVILEAALAVPIFLSFVLGFVDLGHAVLQTSQGTSASADGARVGILRYQQADVVGSSDWTAIEDAVRKRLVGQSLDPVNGLKVRCVNSSGSKVTCASADPERDRIEVTVTWAYVPLSPLGHTLAIGNIQGQATMGLVGQPIDLPPR